MFVSGLWKWILYMCIIDAYDAMRKRTIRGVRGEPTLVRTNENDTVLLPCYVEDPGEQTTVRWWREKILLVDSKEPSVLPPERVTLYSNGSLQVQYVQQEDSGVYVCQAGRPAPLGHVSQAHKIEVMYPPSVETVPTSGELEVNLGETVDMQCVANGVPTPIISWRTKDEEIPLLDPKPLLRFSADNRNFSGTYTCVATNEIGSAMAHIDLRIKYKPEIYVKKPWIHASPGARIQLDCTVIAWPKAKVEWYFNNKILKNTPRTLISDIENKHILLIRNVNTTDYGPYLCRASNSLGITEKIIELTPIANPAVFKKESHNTSSTSYNFIWEVDSYVPIIEYQFWFRKYMKGAAGKWHKLHIPGGSDTVSPVHTRSFNLTGLDEATHYEAVVLSRNRYGWSHPSEILRFHTEGAPIELNENLETDGNQEQNRIPNAVQLLYDTSMPWQHPVTDGSMYNRAKMLPLILSMLIIKYFDYNTQ